MYATQNQALGSGSIGGSVAGNSIPSASVTNELARLREAVDAAVNLAGSFVDRSHPVMRASAPTADSGATEVEADTPLGNELRGLSQRLERFADFMREANSRLAV